MYILSQFKNSCIHTVKNANSTKNCPKNDSSPLQLSIPQKPLSLTSYVAFQKLAVYFQAQDYILKELYNGKRLALEKAVGGRKR